MQQVLAPLIGPSGPYYTDLTGKTAIVTGGATGIGLEVSHFFCLMGCRVIMVNRKSEQGDSAIEYIKKDYKEKKGAEGGEAKIEWTGCDLGNLKEVKEVFSGLASKLDRLDLVGHVSTQP
jgi:NAD(P)-dependent dehydrogenase (short-subunit alcohol dehydrogenase family)